MARAAYVSSFVMEHSVAALVGCVPICRPTHTQPAPFPLRGATPSSTRLPSPPPQADGGALLENVRERGEQLRAGLEQLQQKFPQTIAGKRSLTLPNPALVK